MIDAHSSQPQYDDHLSAIWFGLPPEMRGAWWAAGRCADDGNRHGLPNWRRGYPPPGETPTLVAGYADETAVRRPVIYLEHGAGQSYISTPDVPVRGAEAYSGGPGHERVILFLCPSETVAARWRAKYPDTPAVAVGVCRLDYWHAGMLRGRLSPFGRERGNVLASLQPDTKSTFVQPTLAITWHSDSHTCPETRTAFPHYQSGLEAAVAVLRAAGWQVLGHGHPRIWGTVEAFWEAIGVEAVESSEDVLRRADVLAVDNSSFGYEFASLDRPTVWMNAPWWRRDVHHGLRFWDLIPGEQIDRPDELPEAVFRALDDPPEMRGHRRSVIGQVYCAADGEATARAVAAISETVCGRRRGQAVPAAHRLRG